MAEEQTLQAEGGALGSLLRRGWSMIVLGAVGVFAYRATRPGAPAAQPIAPSASPVGLGASTSATSPIRNPAPPSSRSFNQALPANQPTTPFQSPSAYVHGHGGGHTTAGAGGDAQDPQ